MTMPAPPHRHGYFLPARWRPSRAVIVASVLAVGTVGYGPGAWASSFSALAQTESGREESHLSGPTDVSTVHSTLQESGFAGAETRRGMLHAGSNAGISLSGFDDARFTTFATAAARLSLTDIIFSGPGATVITAFNLSTTARLFTLDHATGQGGDAASFSAFAQFSVAAGLSGPGVLPAVPGQPSALLGSRTRSFALATIDGVPQIHESGTGVLGTDFDGNAIVTSGPYRVPVLTPIALTMDLRASAIAVGTDGPEHGPFGLRGVTALSTFFLSFPRDMPVFDLPPNFTANSLDGLIVDNRWPLVRPAPEASASVLLAAGAIVLLAERLRRGGATRPGWIGSKGHHRIRPVPSKSATTLTVPVISHPFPSRHSGRNTIR